MYMLVLYVPEEFLEQVKEAVFAAGAGSVGHYEACCWQTSGRGQFKPGEGSRPFFGKVGETEYVDEYRVEMVCKEEFIDEVVEALKKSHPYETPAYVCWKVRT
ncbi:MAG: NGG1p interacting factor NIF3 [Verrucomicrobiota bacterium]